MAKKVKTRTLYKLVGSDYSAQEPRLTAHMADEEAMKQAYVEGKDLYCVIASKIYNNDYWDNTEFYKEGFVLELDGKKTIAGSDKSYKKQVSDKLEVPYYYLVPTTSGDKQAADINTGDKVVAEEGAFEVTAVEIVGENTVIHFKD
jgi:hypothetical protein